MKELIIYVVIAIGIIGLVKKAPVISDYWSKARNKVGSTVGLKNYKFEGTK